MYIRIYIYINVSDVDVYRYIPTCLSTVEVRSGSSLVELGHPRSNRDIFPIREEL